MKSVNLFLLACMICASCAQQGNFRGKMSEFTESDATKEVTPRVVKIDSLHSRTFVVVDSLAIFYETLTRSHSFQVFNINNGKEVGRYCPIGHGNGEYMALSPISAIENHGGLKTLLYAPNESKRMVWDITESIKQNTTVMSDIRDFSAKEGSSSSSISFMCGIGKDSVIVKLPATPIPNSEGIIPARYQIRKLSTNEVLSEIQLFENLENLDKIEGGVIMPGSFYSSFFSLKPDKSKFVETMMYLPQINIVDISTGKAHGYKLQNYPENTLEEKNFGKIMGYYVAAQSTDSNIFALFCGTTLPNASDGFDILHVYDWDGNMINKVKLKNPVHSIWLDSKNSLLYGLNANENDLYCYKVSDLVAEKE